jgi:hypothetical protein
VNYSDGTNTTKSLTFTDWCQSPSSSEKIAYSMDHRIYTKSGITGPATNLFVQPIVVDSSKQITSITLPNKSGAKIFAMSLVNLIDPDTLSHNTSLSSIKIGDTPLANFDKSTLEYNVPLPASTTAAPKVTVTTDDTNAFAVVTQASKFPGTATITVTADDGLTVGTYKVNFKIKLGSAALTVDNTSLERNSTAKAAVTAKLDNNTDTDIAKTTVEYLTSDPTVAAIDKNTGVITAVNVGTAEVYAKVTLDGVTVESNKITVTVDTSTASIGKLIDGYTNSKELVGPLVPQLTNSLGQANMFNEDKKVDQALNHMGDFVKLLNNPPMDSRISDSAKEVLNLDAKALISKWSK